MLRAVFFDLDDTLINSAPAWRAGLADAVTALCERRPELSADDVFAAWSATSHALGTRLEAGELTVAAVRSQRWVDTLHTLQLDDQALATTLEAHLEQAFIAGLRIFDDLGTLPEDLRAGHYHVGIITNGADDLDALDSQRSKAAHTGLLARVDSFLASDAVGTRKPDPRIFWLALERTAMALEPSEALYVGDNIANDIAGANHAGMRSVLLWRGPAPLPVLHDAECPNHTITSLAQLTALLPTPHASR